jgi:hypothetical protein
MPFSALAVSESSGGILDITIWRQGTPVELKDIELPDGQWGRGAGTARASSAFVQARADDARPAARLP